MTPLTQCNFKERSGMLMHPAMLVRVFLVLFVGVSLAMSVTYLRFRTHDLQIETSKLQKQRLQLISQKNHLTSQVESLKRYEPKLREYAQTQLGLQESAPERSARVVVSAETMRRYNDMMNGSLYEENNRAAEPTQRLLAVLGEKVTAWSSVSMAREPVATK